MVVGSECITLSLSRSLTHMLSVLRYGYVLVTVLVMDCL